MARKFRTQETGDQNILALYQHEIGDIDGSIEWITPTNNIRTSPPSSILAVVVDIGSNAGAVRIHEAEGGKFVDGVGTEEAGHVVIVPWDGNWYYYTIGRIRLGYIRRADRSDG
ncbi:hypothetical protein AJ78_06059 [Emergomyces pasteurianus Ep9510]|uniref:Uncharacterized protein n=1 Tax=Emergomyces pasteurianus Ep9510 TaxID=1447872 RepID=A0A1J9QBG0_9EURO|nr:hypothetical protein AJ78_06059 [Emergomyces pasteurianus Ep9510]